MGLFSLIIDGFRRGRLGAGVVCAGLACAGALPAGGQQPAKTMLVMPPAPLLPQSAGTLTAVGMTSELAGELRPEVFGGSSAQPAVVGSGDGATTLAALKEDGISRLAMGEYRSARGGATLHVSAFEFGDATGAYSAYTFARSFLHSTRVTAGDAKLGKATETTSDAQGTLLWAGTAVLRVEGRIAPADLAALSGGLPKVGGRRGLAPLLPTYLPGKGLQAGTERYALGRAGYKAMGGMLPAELLAWDKSAEVITAEYAARGDKGTVTLMLYPTPQIAGDRGRALEKYVNEAGLAQFGTLKMRRVGPLLGMTTGGLGAEQASDLMMALHLTQDLSFDKPMPLEFHAEVRKTATLLQSIAMFCVVGLLAALVLGVFLGGARAGIRVLMGKSAASDPEFLTINLRSDKRGLFAGDGDVEERARR